MVFFGVAMGRGLNGWLKSLTDLDWAGYSGVAFLASGIPLPAASGLGLIHLGRSCCVRLVALAVCERHHVHFTRSSPHMMCTELGASRRA